MKDKFRISLKRTLAFISALTIITSAVLLTGFAEDEATEPTETVEATVETDTETESSTEAETTTEQDNPSEKPVAETETKSVDDYTKLFPGLTDTKLKLSDPKFTEKEWYEYIEYEFYTEVKDGDMTYRIYQPTDYGAASIMAITDYNPKEVLGGTSSITMNLGELQGVLDIAAQGGNISKEFVGLDLATGIASQMNSINEVMDNSKYYSKSSFLGIPGDKKYTGVSNDGYFNADSLEIEIVEAEVVTACKTVAMDSSYTISDLTENGKNSAKRVEVYDANINTHDEQNYNEDSNTSGRTTIDTSIEQREEHSLSFRNEILQELSEHTSSEMTQQGFEGGSGGCEKTFGIVALYSNGRETTHEDKESYGTVSEKGCETGTIKMDGKEHSIENNVENTNMTGKSSGDSSTIEHALTSGNEDGVTYSHADEMSVDVGYGVDYQYGNEHSLSVGVKRIFNAREDKEVKNVGWKLCEYVVKIPYYIEAVKTESDGTEKVLYGQYVNYNLLNGVSRVFANGYIEHWYTGELVTYADFFDGFITATELVEKAQEQQKAKLPEEAK